MTWRAGVLSLPDWRVPCPGMIWFDSGRGGRSGVWAAVRTAMLAFLDQWGEEAAGLGWSTESLFGVHRTAGAERADSTGALVTVRPRTVIALDRHTITTARGESRLVDRGLPNPGDSVPIWAFRPAT